MLQNFFLDLLVDPRSGTPLKLNASGDMLHADGGTAYKVVQNVPVILDAENSINGDFNYAEHYEKDAQVTDYFAEENAITRDERNRSRQAIINTVPGDADLILDIGCGSGWVAGTFLKKNRNVISSDISFINPSRALNTYPSANHAALNADVFQMPLKPASFDAIIASEVLEHVPDPTLFIQKLMALLKPGGKLIMLTPYNEKIIKHLCIHCNMQTPANAHLHSFNESNIRNVIPAGMKYDTKRFNNKYFVRLRIYSLLRFLPFSLWNMLDKAANGIFKKPSLFLIQIIK